MLFDDDNALDVERLLVLLATITWYVITALSCGVTVLAYQLLLFCLG